MPYHYTPKYYFDGAVKRWMPATPRLVYDLELDMPWQDRPMVRGKKLREEITAVKREAEARVVIDYAKVGEDMTFATKDPTSFTGRGKDVVLKKGRIVEVMEPSPYDQKDIDKKKESGIQLVTIRWLGRIRLVYATHLFRSNAGAFNNQPPEDT